MIIKNTASFQHRRLRRSVYVLLGKLGFYKLAHYALGSIDSLLKKIVKKELWSALTEMEKQK